MARDPLDGSFAGGLRVGGTHRGARRQHHASIVLIAASHPGGAAQMDPALDLEYPAKSAGSHTRGDEPALSTPSVWPQMWQSTITRHS